MRLLTAVSGVRVPQQAPEKKPAKVSFLFCYFCYYLEPPTLFSPCTTPACRTDAENALFRRTVCSLRGFVSAGRRRKRNLLRFLFFVLLSLLLSRTPYAVFALHDSRVQNRCRKRAIPSRSALLTGVRVRGQAPEKKPIKVSFFLLFLFTVSFLELLIFRFLSGQMFSVPKEKAAEKM